MTRFLRFVCPVLAIGFLASGYFLTGRAWPALGLLVFGSVRMVGLALYWKWLPSLALFALFGIAGLGIFLNLSPVLLIPGALFALASWDLAEFHLRLRLASPEDDLAALEKRHLLRLAGLILIGGLLSTFALTLQVKPSFEWVVILMFFAVWGIGQVVGWLLKKEQ